MPTIVMMGPSTFAPAGTDIYGTDIYAAWRGAPAPSASSSVAGTSSITDTVDPLIRARSMPAEPNPYERFRFADPTRGRSDYMPVRGSDYMPVRGGTIPVSQNVPTSAYTSEYVAPFNPYFW